MNRIDRYISGLFWTYFIGGSLVFITIFLAVDAMSTMVSYKGVEMTVFLRYYIYYLPEIFSKLLPVACLMGTILAISSMNKANELVALFASGMSLIRITMPLLLWVALVSGAAFFVMDKAGPAMSRKKNFIEYNEIRKTPTMFSTVKTNKIWYRSKNAIFNIKTLNVQGDRAQSLTLYFFSPEWDLMQMITAATVDLNGTTWNLKDGSVTLFTGNATFPLTSTFKEKTLSMGEDSKDLQSSGQTSDMLSQSELSQFIDRNKEAGLDTIRYEVDYQSKYSFAFAGLVMCLLGIPFSVGKARSGGTMMNVGIVIFLVFGYWILYSSSLTLGSHGHLTPILAAWAPNLLMVALSYFFLLRLKR
ncbi:MAG: LPS export ABC transporter permease LptG [Bdellovibrionaceae bacterium]|nr:LPS export ABC transporter permease LptG [Pseudobdellovibrionaceae bacterium]